MMDAAVILSHVEGLIRITRPIDDPNHLGAKPENENVWRAGQSQGQHSARDIRKSFCLREALRQTIRIENGTSDIGRREPVAQRRCWHEGFTA